MKPFRMSFAARALSAVAAFALIGGGLVPVLPISASVAVPVLLLVPVGVGFVALVLSARDYANVVLLLAVLLPPAVFAYTLGLMVVVERSPSFSWVLVALGSVPVCLFIASLGFRSEREPAAVQVSSPLVLVRTRRMA